MNSLYRNRTFNVRLDVKDADKNPVTFSFPACAVTVGEDGKSLDCIFVPGLAGTIHLSHSVAGLASEISLRSVDQTKASVERASLRASRYWPVADIPVDGPNDEVVGSNYFIRFSERTFLRGPAMPFSLTENKGDGNVAIAKQFGLVDGDYLWFRLDTFRPQSGQIHVDPYRIPREVVQYADHLVHVIHSRKSAVLQEHVLKQRSPDGEGPEMTDMLIKQLATLPPITFSSPAEQREGQTNA